MKEDAWTVFAERVFARAHEHVAYGTVPLAGSLDGKSTLDRTGVLFRIAGIPFLITAQHGLSEIIEAGYLLFVPPPVPDGEMVAIVFDNLWLSTRDVADVAVVRLYDEIADQLVRNDYRFFTLADIASNEWTPANQSNFLVAGFPTALEDRDSLNRKRCEYYPWLTTRWEGNREELPDQIDPKAQLLLNYPREAHHTTGAIARTPSPRGLSGCGVWCVCRADLTHLWMPEDMKLVGIQGSWYHRGRCLKATWIDEPMAMIWQKYSDTRDAMRLIGLDYG